MSIPAKLLSKIPTGAAEFDRLQDIWMGILNPILKQQERFYEQIFDLYAFVAGKPASGITVGAWTVARSASFAGSFAGSQASATVAATANTVLTLYLNAPIAPATTPTLRVVGTIAFPAASKVGIFAATNPGLAALITNVVPGDVLSVVNPTPQDATLADVSITLKGTSSV